jgi:hypothetical protein
VKHYFHFLFTGALLLGSLILFNNQKSECPNYAMEDRAIEHIELQAELPSRFSAESLVQIYRHDPGIVPESIPDKLRKLESMNNASRRMRIRQMHIHLGLKPALDKQSGQYLHHRSSYDDPPTC